MEEAVKSNHDKNWTREILLYFKNLSKIEKQEEFDEPVNMSSAIRILAEFYLQRELLY